MAEMTPDVLEDFLDGLLAARRLVNRAAEIMERHGERARSAELAAAWKVLADVYGLVKCQHAHPLASAPHVASVSQANETAPVLSRCTCGWQGPPSYVCGLDACDVDKARRRAERLASQHAATHGGQVAWPS